MSSITVLEKKIFLRHFLEKYTLQSRICTWILAHLLEEEDKLERIRFTDSISGSKNAMILATECAVDEADFYGVVDGIKTYDSEKMFNLIRFNEDDEFQIELRFFERMSDPYFLAVLEENKKTRIRVSAKEKVMIEALLKHSIDSNARNILMLLIDDALLTGNRERFNELSKQYKEMLINE